ncbi:unnamed protein product [Rhizoctonia solani]|uniref:Uncharacterized protein n=1 Tax=Rhizoctonia solani TaxID=456999 RepID=A0A8H3E724_9AGAM|nr:unnamed protein product [Rhizoctonia solani]
MSFYVTLMISLWGSLLVDAVDTPGGSKGPYNYGRKEEPGTRHNQATIAAAQLLHNPRDLRTNTTAHLIFSSVSGLLQHWPNTIYTNGHTFVPCTIPAGTPLYHSRPSFDPPPSPEFFAFDVDHSYIFCATPPCVMYTYVPTRDLKLGYFDGTSAAILDGARDLQDIAFNDRFIPGNEYNPWTHAISMCGWAKQVGLAGIVRMEPSFEAVLCNIDSDLELVSSQEIVYHETMVFPGQRIPGGPNVTSSTEARRHPRFKSQQPYLPGPAIPAYPPPPGWQGKQYNSTDAAYESIRAGMWHNHFPGESRVILDYSGIVSAYDEAYTSLTRSRQEVPRSKHRLNNISATDVSRLKSEMEEVLKPGRPLAAVNWQSVFKDIVNRYAERLEDLRYLLGRSDLNPEEIVASARQKILVMLTPYMVLPQSKPNSARANIEAQTPLHAGSGSASQNGPDEAWLRRIYDACAKYPTIEFARRRGLTAQEERLVNSIDVVQAAICSSLTTVWAEAFGSGDRPLFARHMVATWKAEVEELMNWLDWHAWVKCDPPCGPGLQCVLATWPWEVQTGEEDIGPTCRDHLTEGMF